MQRSLGVLIFLCGASAVAVADMAVAPPPEAPRVRRPPPPPKPKPSPVADVTAHAADLVGTWQCKGTLANGDGSSQARHATIVAKLDLDNAWLTLAVTENTESTGKRTAYRTFDPVAKQWTQIAMASTGAATATSSAGEANGEWTFAGVEQSVSGTVQVKDHESRGKGTWKLWGEALLGGAWTKTYELACTK